MVPKDNKSFKADAINNKHPYSSDKSPCCLHLSTYVMAIRVVEFSSGGIKLERFLPKNQHTQRKFLNFENWTNGEPQ